MHEPRLIEMIRFLHQLFVAHRELYKLNFWKRTREFGVPVRKIISPQPDTVLARFTVIGTRQEKIV